MKNNKIALYAVGALFLGATTFFVWSFFKKSNVPMNNKDVSSSNEVLEDDKKDFTKYFSQLPTEFAPIRTPNITRNLQEMF
jgi:hypothetical protein